MAISLTGPFTGNLDAAGQSSIGSAAASSTGPVTLIAMISGSRATAATCSVSSVAGGGANVGVWELLVRKNTTAGTCAEIWTATSTGAVSGAVTATFNVANMNATQIVVFCLTNALSKGNTVKTVYTGGTPAILSLNGVNPTSLLFSCGINYTNANTPTTLTGTIASNQNLSATSASSSLWAWQVTSPVGATAAILRGVVTGSTTISAVAVEVKDTGVSQDTGNHISFSSKARFIPNTYATLDFGEGSNEASYVVTGESGIVAGSSVEAYLMATDSTNDHSINDHLYVANDLQLTCGTIVPGVGFTIYGRSSQKLTGLYRVRWVWV